jgi:hypothetical protein
MTYPALELSEIDLPRLKLVKEVVQWFGDQDHSRWVFQAPKNYQLAGEGGLFLKIWNPSYIRRDNLLTAIEAGFYDQELTPALQAVIFHEGICRGYSMRRCRPSRGLDPEFYRKVQEKTAATKLFHYQFSRYHAMRFQDGHSLVDLEGVYPVDELPGLTSSYHCKFDDADYERFVTELCPGVASRPDKTDSPTSVEPGLLARVQRLVWRKPRSLLRNLWRAAVTKWGTIRHHKHLIES